MKSIAVVAAFAVVFLANGAEWRVSLLAPCESKSARLAAEAFADIWEKVADERPAVVSELPAEGDVVVFGEEQMNPFTFRQRLAGKLPPNEFRNGSDAYRLLSQKEGDRTLLFLLNARPRSLFYAVYRFFELRADCSWFWDGDRIPKGRAPDIDGLDVTESPRFDWRGLRYFANRSTETIQPHTPPCGLGRSVGLTSVACATTMTGMSRWRRCARTWPLFSVNSPPSTGLAQTSA